MFSQTKNFLFSKTIWGGIMMALVALASFWGYSISDVEQTQITDLLQGIVASVASLLAIVGRIKARQMIGLRAG